MRALELDTELVEPGIDEELLAQAVARVIRPVLVTDGALSDPKREGYHHGVILPVTQPLLTREAIESDPVGSVFGALKADVNLLSQFEQMKARTLLEHESAEPDSVREEILALLYGEGELADRVGRFCAWGAPRFREDGAELSVNATVASYLLATSQPGQYAFCKPRVYAPAAKALLGESVGPSPPGLRVAHCTAFYREALRLLRDVHGLPFTDLMHVHVAFYVVGNYGTPPGWEAVSAPDAASLSPVQRFAFDELVRVFMRDYATAERGREHLATYVASRADAVRRYAEICGAADRGEDVTDAVLKGLLPHQDTTGNRARGAWRHPASAVTKDVQSWFEGAGWVAPGDWPSVARVVLTFVRRCVEDPGDLEGAVHEFAASGHGKGLQAGMLSPVLSALLPDTFSVVNSKSVALVNRVAGTKHDTRLEGYAEANMTARSVVALLGPALENAGVHAEADADALDMMAHWLVTEAVKTETIKGVPLAEPLASVFESAAEAEWAFDLLRRTLDLLGVEGRGDPRVALTMPRHHGGKLIRLNFGPWMILDFRGGPQPEVGLTLGVEEADALGVTERLSGTFAPADGEAAVGVYRFPPETVRSTGEGIIVGYEATLARIGRRFGGWGSPYRASHQVALEAAVFDKDARAVLFQGGVVLAPPPSDGPVRAWKVAPGDGGWQWDESVEGNFIGVGWEDLGDLTGVTEDEFRRRQADVAGRFGWSTKATNQVWRLATEVREGDRIVANRGTTEVLGIGTVAGPYYYAAGERHAHRLPVRWDDTTPRRVLFGGWRQTLLAVREADFQAILKAGVENEPIFPQQPAYSLAQCADETGVAETELARWVRAIERKGQGVLYGPPGTGKTYLAERLARHLVGGTDGTTETVQFHPAYTYEDFVEGIRPRTRDGQLHYPLEPGQLLRFCELAESREGPCVLVIDEINRANLSRVFGELMYLLEYRDREVVLASGRRFRVPRNVRIIGTMNTADRSIALVDHALRRRFAFVRLWPDFDVLRRFHRRAGMGFPVDALVGELERLNEQIGDPHYALGISYFLDVALGDHLEDVWRMEIEPYLDEYFFDHPEKAEEFAWDRVAKRVTPERAGPLSTEPEPEPEDD